MNRIFKLSVVLGILMGGSALVAKALTADVLIAQYRPPQKLENVVPKQFGIWREEENAGLTVINPQAAAILNKIYTQTLSRTYINEDGYRVMLSIAYGADQRDGNAVHYPEVCYPAQGFQINSRNRGEVSTSFGTIAVTKLESNFLNQRYEPITYWTTIGDVVVKGPLDKKLTELKFALERKIPDGVIFRVSSIDNNTRNAFSIQEGFVSSLAAVLDPLARKQLMGILQ